MASHQVVYNAPEANSAIQAYKQSGVSANPGSEPKFGVTPDGLYFLNNSSDSYVNAMNQAQQWAVEKAIREEGYQREDYALDRLVNAAQRNGINPLFLLSGALDNVGAYSGQSASTFKTSNYDSNAKTEEANSAKIFAALIAMIGMMAAAAL